MVFRPLGRTLGAAAILLGGIFLTPARPALAECRVAEFRFNPVSDLQIVVWIEDTNGNYVDTVYITRATGSLGLGNRPGRYDFNSEILWPYGRRENVLPVWAHRRGATYPRVVYQDGDEDDLSHSISDSSTDPYYCRPLRAGETAWANTIDTGSCATRAYTDKGILSDHATSLYPPRNDLDVRQSGDSDAMMSYADLNDLDVISRATPPGDQPVLVRWSVPADLPVGDYVAWIEVSRESDFNSIYNPNVYPSPAGLPWSEYGHPYRGQPSVAWQVPFSVGPAEHSYLTDAYAGYGDPSGVDGTLSPPDHTITTIAGSYDVAAGPGGNPPARTVDNLGAARLQLEASPEGNYQFRVDIRPVDDSAPPAAPAAIFASQVYPREANIHFVAPGDDGFEGSVTSYEIRFGVGAPPTDAAGFRAGAVIGDGLRPQPARVTQALALANLEPETQYWVGVRALDDCLNQGDIAFTSFVTPAAEQLAVDACFVATAAWGSLMERHVTTLRGFRDRVLRSQILGEIVVEAYYTFGPALAEVIRPSETLRGMTRRGLSPVVDFARTFVE